MKKTFLNSPGSQISFYIFIPTLRKIAWRIENFIVFLQFQESIYLNLSGTNSIVHCKWQSRCILFEAEVMVRTASGDSVARGESESQRLESTKGLAPSFSRQGEREEFSFIMEHISCFLMMLICLSSNHFHLPLWFPRIWRIELQSNLAILQPSQP